MDYLSQLKGMLSPDGFKYSFIGLKITDILKIRQIVSCDGGASVRVCYLTFVVSDPRLNINLIAATILMDPKSFGRNVSNKFSEIC